MTVEITSTDGLFQFKVNESKPTELMVRKNKLGARWYPLSHQDSAVLSLKALLATKDRQDGVLYVTIDFVPFDIEQLARTVHVLRQPLDEAADVDSAALKLVTDALRSGEDDSDEARE